MDDAAAGVGRLNPFPDGEAGQHLAWYFDVRQRGSASSAEIDAHFATWTRRRWLSLAAHFGVDAHVIVCVCSDDKTRQRRLTSRSRGIRGWHDGGNWYNVRLRRDKFRPWAGEHFELDDVTPLEEKLRRALPWIAGS